MRLSTFAYFPLGTLGIDGIKIMYTTRREWHNNISASHSNNKALRKYQIIVITLCTHWSCRSNSNENSILESAGKQGNWIWRRLSVKCCKVIFVYNLKYQCYCFVQNLIWNTVLFILYHLLNYEFECAMGLEVYTLSILWNDLRTYCKHWTTEFPNLWPMEHNF